MSMIDVGVEGTNNGLAQGACLPDEFVDWFRGCGSDDVAPTPEEDVIILDHFDSIELFDGAFAAGHRIDEPLMLQAPLILLEMPSMWNLPL